MIKTVIEAMLNRDCLALAACFTERCRYFDYCPIGVNKENYHIYGRQSIEMFFLNMFTFGKVIITDPVIEGPDSANYLVSYSGTYLNAKMVIEKYAEDGLIQEIAVRPA